MLLVERYPADNPVIRFFQNRDQPENIRLAMEQVRNSDIVGASFKVAGEYCAAARRSLEALPRGKAYDSLIELADFVVMRRK
jgi:geranylgeranyl pyrophosphate synthase